MTKQVFFTFDFDDDLWRASVVRNRWIDDPSLAAGGLWGPEFTAGVPPTEDMLERFVDEQVDAADVTVVLIGARTTSCEHVLYAIRRSAALGRGLLGIYVDQCKNRYGSTSVRGRNPFDRVLIDRGGRDVSLADSVALYDWVDEDGFANLPAWIDTAVARAVARAVAEDRSDAAPGTESTRR